VITEAGRSPLITREDDKEIINAEVLANSSSNAFEVLEKTQVIIDQDGTAPAVQLQPLTLMQGN
jgi:hypothetical protein